jgi:succinate-acetate transporter protein
MIPVEITGITVISVSIFVLTVIALVSNQIMKNIFVFLSIFFFVLGMLSMANNSRIPKLETFEKTK